MKRHVLTVDLVPQPRRIAAYLRYHRAIWPEVARSLRRVGIRALDIHRLGRRLVMIMDTRDDFDLRRSMARHRSSHPRCAEWEERMKTFQRSPPGARAGEVWARMTRIFQLSGRTHRPGRKSKRRVRSSR